ncbi:MAG: aldehyde dehydrogenase family protein [Hydrogenophilaceae bacterium]|jgi:aldehyde dehydrogenase (NAD+)|nr:aldehyde dehydrogenase family protein [Hydrogenophilaceae bacterium]
MTIDGRAVAAESTFDVINPATGAAFAKAPDCSRAELDEAVAAARRAQPAWAALPFEQRREKVAALSKILEANLDPLMRLLTQENGKPHGDAQGEIVGAAYYFMTAAQLSLPIDVLEDDDDRRTVIQRVPIGVVGAILPWNFPVLVFAFKVIPALLAGNAIVCKPSPYTPLTTLVAGKLLADALPPGLLNIVSGGNDLGAWMTAHPGIDKIAFTGSSATGKKIMAGAADGVKRISLELGGNDPAIVLPDVDVEATSQRVFWGAFANNGQICAAAKRVYVHEDIYDGFLKALITHAQGIKIGDGAMQGVQIGPLQNKMQYDKVKELTADCIANGYRMHVAGDPPTGAGYFLPITIVDNPPDDARIVVEEQFGPLLPVMKYRDEADVIRRANDSPYGLSASVWAKDPARAEAIAAQLDVGYVYVNTIHEQPLTAPIAGHKQSGLGEENGNVGLLEYTNARTITVRKRLAQAA